MVEIKVCFGDKTLALFTHLKKMDLGVLNAWLLSGQSDHNYWFFSWAMEVRYSRILPPLGTMGLYPILVEVKLVSPLISH